MDDINPAYDDAMLAEAARSFKLSGNLQLLSFLLKAPDVKQLKFERVYVPEKFLYGVAKAPSLKELNLVLRQLTGKKFTFVVMKFEQGDYKVLYDDLKPGKGVVVMLDLFDGDESWGGYTSFMKDDEEIVRVVAKKNALTLINQSGLRSFTKYVNHRTMHPRIFLYGVQQK